MRTNLKSGTPLELVEPTDPSGGLVVLADVLGLRPLYEHIAIRLAQGLGWTVGVCEPFPGREDMRLGDRLRSLANFDWKRQSEDCLLAADLVGIKGGPVSALGFCLGGAGVIRMAGHERFRRAVAFYGMIRLPREWVTGGITDPIDDLAACGAAATKLLNIAGGADSHVPVSDQEDLARLGATTVTYEGADHGFVHDPTAPVHRPDDAADAWQRALKWLRADDIERQNRSLH